MEAHELRVAGLSSMPTHAVIVRNGQGKATQALLATPNRFFSVACFYATHMPVHPAPPITLRTLGCWFSSLFLGFRLCPRSLFLVQRLYWWTVDTQPAV